MALVDGCHDRIGSVMRKYLHSHGQTRSIVRAVIEKEFKRHVFGRMGGLLATIVDVIAICEGSHSLSWAAVRRVRGVVLIRMRQNGLACWILVWPLGIRLRRFTGLLRPERTGRLLRKHATVYDTSILLAAAILPTTVLRSLRTFLS